MKHTTRAEHGLIFRILGIVGQLGLLLGVKMIEVAEKFIEPVHGGKARVAVAQVVLAELAGRIAQILKYHTDRRVLLAHPHRGARETHLRETCA